MDSVVGRSCSLRYNTNVDCISNFDFAPHNIDRYAVASQVDLNTSALLLELLQCHDSSLTLPSDNFNNAYVAAMIDILCTR